MNLGFSGESFGNLLVLDTFIAFLFIGLIGFISHKRGVDVTTHRFQIKVLTVAVTIFLIIPFSLCDLSVKSKIIGIALILAAIVGNYIGFDKMRRVLWGDSVDKKKNPDQKG
jgi:hypothetical protein